MKSLNLLKMVGKLILGLTLAVFAWFQLMCLMPTLERWGIMGLTLFLFSIGWLARRLSHLRLVGSRKPVRSKTPMGRIITSTIVIATAIIVLVADYHTVHSMVDWLKDEAVRNYTHQSYYQNKEWEKVNLGHNPTLPSLRQLETRYGEQFFTNLYPLSIDQIREIRVTTIAYLVASLLMAETGVANEGMEATKKEVSFLLSDTFPNNSSAGLYHGLYHFSFSHHPLDPIQRDIRYILSSLKKMGLEEMGVEPTTQSINTDFAGDW